MISKEIFRKFIVSILVGTVVYGGIHYFVFTEMYDNFSWLRLTGMAFIWGIMMAITFAILGKFSRVEDKRKA